MLKANTNFLHNQKSRYNYCEFSAKQVSYGIFFTYKHLSKLPIHKKADDIQLKALRNHSKSNKSKANAIERTKKLVNSMSNTSFFDC